MELEKLGWTSGQLVSLGSFTARRSSSSGSSSSFGKSICLSMLLQVIFCNYVCFNHFFEQFRGDVPLFEVSREVVVQMNQIILVTANKAWHSKKYLMIFLLFFWNNNYENYYEWTNWAGRLSRHYIEGGVWIKVICLQR